MSMHQHPIQNLRSHLVAAALSLLAALPSQAAPSAEEAARLGTTLTPFGAEKAGNKDGSIPEYTGGLCAPPAGYKPLDPNGGFPYVDPYADEKPLFSIDGKNMDKYLDKLDEGSRQLLKQFPRQTNLQRHCRRRRRRPPRPCLPLEKSTRRPSRRWTTRS